MEILSEIIVMILGVILQLVWLAILFGGLTLLLVAAL